MTGIPANIDKEISLVGANYWRDRPSSHQAVSTLGGTGTLKQCSSRVGVISGPLGTASQDPHLLEPGCSEKPQGKRSPVLPVADPGFPVGGGADLVGGGANSRGSYISKICMSKWKNLDP